MRESSQSAQLIAGAEAVFLDWDGCLADSDGLLPGARELLLALGRRAYILSNNSTDLPQDLQRRLGAAHVQMEKGNILLAGHQTLLRQAVISQGRPVHLVANPTMTAFAASLDMRLSHGDADCVILLRDTSFTFDALAAAANSARRSGHIVAANPDGAHPGPNGTIAPETGALLAAVVACLAGAPVEVEVVGKPQPTLFRAALSSAKVEPGRAVMIGDNRDTDGAGAASCGIPFVQVDPRGPTTMAVLATEVDLALSQFSRTAGLR
ncbi:HAD family hydrolase (plasmid) [Brevundimonas staleyi]|uniref:HAD family hydrolase n=1 Tax=Brevundimonas staleyi TaxID=74326 RepID=A0ABW0FPA8_9CAUL